MKNKSLATPLRLPVLTDLIKAVPHLYFAFSCPSSIIDTDYHHLLPPRRLILTYEGNKKDLMCVKPPQAVLSL